jgi:hypothetical protein
MPNDNQTTKPSPACDAACYASVFHPSESDRGFLMWVHERLEHVHGESCLRDYMHKLRAIIADMPAGQNTVSVGQGKNSLEALQEELSQHNH